MRGRMWPLNACMAVVHIDHAHAVTHCVPICMDSRRFIRSEGHSADLRVDAYGDLLMF